MPFSTLYSARFAIWLLISMNPARAFPQASKVSTFAPEATPSDLSPAPLNISSDSYTVSAVYRAMYNLTTIFQEAVKSEPYNPLLCFFNETSEIAFAILTVFDAIRNATHVGETADSSAGNTTALYVKETAATPSATTTAVLGSNTPGAPIITIHNLSPAPICYAIEFTSGYLPRPDVCEITNANDPRNDGHWPGIIVPANSLITVYASPDFDGPLNEIIGGKVITVNSQKMLVNGSHGARHEINFAGPEGGVYYDLDLEMGLSNSQIGPTALYPFPSTPITTIDPENPHLGPAAIQGEKDILAKANTAWRRLSLDQKSALAQHTTYLIVTTVSGHTNKDGGVIDYNYSWLSSISHDKLAPAEVKYFLQITAGLQAYVYHGSAPAAAGIREDEWGRVMKAVADLFTHFWEEREVSIVAYADPLV